MMNSKNEMIEKLDPRIKGMSSKDITLRFVRDSFTEEEINDGETISINETQIEEFESESDKFFSDYTNRININELFKNVHLLLENIEKDKNKSNPEVEIIKEKPEHELFDYTFKVVVSYDQYKEVPKDLDCKVYDRYHEWKEKLREIERF